MGTSTLIPVSEYLNAAYEGPDREYIDGALKERSMPTALHSHVQLRIGAYIITHYPDYWAGTELRLRISESRYRVADVVVFRSGMPREPVPAGTPDIVAEVVSPDDRIEELDEKIRDYRASGIANIWVVFPNTRHAHLYTRDGIQEVTDALQAGDIRVPLSAIFPA